MSDYHVQQLRSVETLMEASRASLRFALQNEHRADKAPELSGRRPEEFRQALQETEGVYLVYLFAMFEGILRTHLTQKQPSINVDKQTKVDQLISLVCKQDKNAASKPIGIDPKLRSKINAVRDYRNYLAHGKQGSFTHVEFRDALSALNTFVAKLPDPKP